MRKPHPNQGTYDLFGAADTRYKPKEEVKTETQPVAEKVVEEPKQEAPAEIVKEEPVVAQEEKPAQEEVKADSGIDVEATKTKIGEIVAKIKALNDEIDNNYNLSTMKIREKRREVNHLQSEKNSLEKSMN